MLWVHVDGRFALKMTLISLVISVELKIGISIDLRQPSHFGLSFAKDSLSHQQMLTSSVELVSTQEQRGFSVRG